MSKNIETLKMLGRKHIGMSWTTKLSHALHEFLSGQYLLGTILLFLGLMAVEPMLTMAGAVIIVGMIAISLTVEN